MDKQRRSDHVKHTFCPGCGKQALKKFDAVLRCTVCTRAWFILQCSGSPEKKE